MSKPSLHTLTRLIIDEINYFFLLRPTESHSDLLLSEQCEEKARAQRQVIGLRGKDFFFAPSKPTFKASLTTNLEQH